MKNLTVTLSDVLGVTFPGFLLLLAIGLLHPLFDPLRTFVKWLFKSEAVPEGTRTAVVLGVVFFSYLIGFLVRLRAVKLWQRLTKRWWQPKLEERIAVLGPPLEAALKNEGLLKALKDEAALLGDSDTARHAPFFHFAKRLVYARNPALAQECHRLEAEVRFSAGMSPALLALFISGLGWTYRWAVEHRAGAAPGLLLLVLGVLGMFTVATAFPSRRVREACYLYHMAIIVLSYSSKDTPSEEKDEDG